MEPKAEREQMLAAIHRAIADGRCYLETAWGRRKVTAYSDETGWAVTNNAGQYHDQRSFMVCTTDFIIEPSPRVGHIRDLPAVADLLAKAARRGEPGL